MLLGRCVDARKNEKINNNTLWVKKANQKLLEAVSEDNPEIVEELVKENLEFITGTEAQIYFL